MEETGHRDVVNQVQSTDAPAPVDVSASTIDTPAAAAASWNTPITRNAKLDSSELDKIVTGVATTSESDKMSREGQDHDFGDNANEASQQPTINGTSGDVSAPPSIGQSAESDTDISKNDASETASKGGDAQKHTIKKPSAFKSVSVTKNFLAKAGTTPSPLAKSPLEAAAANNAPASALAVSSARPRLVAKTGSGHKLSMSTQLRNGASAERPTGPDPMQVWNRNRVQTPQATPKHLTDEELRQQYGIQLASIPVLDGDDKGNKWADIDDEEDDWAPEVIEWSDGSKVNLAEAEKAAAQEAKAAEEAKKRDELAKIQQAAAKATSSLGPKATVLRVGSAASQAKSNAEGPASLKAMEKPTLVAKPVAPAPVKSPWAQLPPVERLPPVAANPTQQTPPSQQRPHLVENQVPEQAPASWRGAKEIAADDFSRIPRDAPNGMPRELFNSQSGKYEPVNDARRGSFKKDQNFRQPAVLQRPSAEQESVFAPRKESQDRSVSASSGRRPSVTQPPLDSRAEPQPWRRQSNNWSGQPRAGPQSPSIASADYVPPSNVNSASPPVQPTSLAPPAPAAEDPVAIQKRLMQEKRAAAIKRRQEEEAREEAERKERIAKKLAAMGPAPEKKDKEKPGHASPSKSVSDMVSANQEDKSPTRVKGAESARSPPKPPAPGPSVQHYGMIKVHPSPIANGVSPVMGTVAPGTASMEKETPGHGPSLVKPLEDQTSVNDHRHVVKPTLDQAHREKHPQPEEDSRWNMTQKAWERAGDVANLPSTGNLWAPAGLQRNLGNGDFNLHPSRAGPFRQSQISPEQILPSPQSATPSGIFGESKPAAQSLQPQQGGAFARQYEAGPPFGSKPSGDVHPQPPSTQSRTPGLPSPLAHGLPSQRGLPAPPSQLAPLPEPKLGISAWNSFSQNVADHDAATAARRNQEAMLRLADTEARGLPTNRTIKERWKQTSSTDELGSRRVVGVQTITRNQAPGPPATQSIGIVSEEPRQPPVSMPPQNPKPSRFQTVFKQLNQGPQVVSKPTPAPQRPASPPLPPPESDLHPAFDRVSHKPLVNLPGMHKTEERPVPRVRLPPSQPAPQHSIGGEGHLPARFLQSSAQPLVKTIDWQNRFNGLLKKEAPEKRVREGVDFSSSKTGFDILSVSEAAAVSFPQPGQISPASASFPTGSSDSKSIEQETELFEADLHPGSTPPVRVPAHKVPAHWHAATTSQLNAKKTQQLQFTDHDIMSRRVWHVGREDFHAGKVDVIVRLPGVTTPKKFQMDAARFKNAPPRLSGAQKSKSQHKTARKPRDASGPTTGALPTKPGPVVRRAKSPAPTVPAAPQTWANRVSQPAN